jgi:hypothetical protein
LAVAIPVGRALPELLAHLREPDGWKPVLAALASLGMAAAPADTLGLVRRYLPKKEK